MQFFRLWSSIVLLALLASSAFAAGFVERSLQEWTEGSPVAPTSIADLVWEMTLDSATAEAVLDRVGPQHLAMTDTLLSWLRLSEPQLREQLPALRVLRDDPTREQALVPAWRDVRWSGLRLLRATVEAAPTARDNRLRRDVDAVLESIVRPQNAEMAGLVDIFVLWWAERGDDPALTHDPSRIFSVEPFLQRLQLPSDDSGAWQGIGLLTDLDEDVVLRTRVLAALDPERYRHLCAEMVAVLDVSPDSLVALGVPARRWDAGQGRVVGHAALDLHRLAHEILDRVSGMDTVAEEDLQRRIERLLWWRAARYEARHWRDADAAPSMARFFEGLDRPLSEGGTPIAEWLRALYLEDELTQQRIFEHLGAEQERAVADLVTVLSYERADAIREGFRLSYLSRNLTLGPDQAPHRIAVDWETMKSHARQALVGITGEDPYYLVLSDDASLLDSAWNDWWRLHRREERWYRDGVVPEFEDESPDFELERSRID